ncbi:FG-GAP repeat domain-containing protein, partial [Kibdelosporangium lantanae]
GHVMVFVRWNDSAHHTFTAYEQNGDPNYPHQSTYHWPLSDSRGTYQPYRYKNIVDDTTTAPTMHVRAGDVDGDGRADLVAIDNDGKMYVYHNKGAGGTQTWEGALYAGYGWNFRDVLVADVNGDHRADLIAIADDGNMYVYPNTGGKGTQTWGAPKFVGYGWQFLSQVMANDVNGDGRADLVAVAGDGKMYVYRNKGGDGTQTWDGAVYAGYGWNAYDRILLGDASGDHRSDLIATDDDGKLHVYLNQGGDGTQDGSVSVADHVAHWWLLPALPTYYVERGPLGSTPF